MSDLDIILQIIYKSVKDELIGLNTNEKRIVLESLKLRIDKLIEEL